MTTCWAHLTSYPVCCRDIRDTEWPCASSVYTKTLVLSTDSWGGREHLRLPDEQQRQWTGELDYDHRDKIGSSSHTITVTSHYYYEVVKVHRIQNKTILRYAVYCGVMSGWTTYFKTEVGKLLPIWLAFGFNILCWKFNQFQSLGQRSAIPNIIFTQKPVGIDSYHSFRQ